MSAAAKPQERSAVSTIRRYTIGGPDVAACVGIHPYTSPVMQWAEMTGRLDRGETEAMRWGTLLEEVVRLEVATTHEVDPGPIALVDPEREWVTGTLDGIIHLDSGHRGVYEGKTANSYAAGQWHGGVPLHYAAQCQWYLHLSGLDYAYLALLIGGQKLETHTLVRDNRAIAALLDAAERFYWHLVTDTQPAPDGHPATRDALQRLYPSATAGRVYRLSAAEYRAVAELHGLREQRDAIDAQIAERENVIRAAMGDAETALSPHDEVVATWKSGERRALDQARLKAEQPTLVADYMTTTTTRTFKLKGGR